MPEKTIMAPSYLNFSIQEIHIKAVKNGGFGEELFLVKTTLRDALTNFCCMNIL